MGAPLRWDFVSLALVLVVIFATMLAFAAAFLWHESVQDWTR